MHSGCFLFISLKQHAMKSQNFKTDQIFCLKWTVLLKTEVLSSFTRHHVISNLYDFFIILCITKWHVNEISSEVWFMNESFRLVLLLTWAADSFMTQKNNSFTNWPFSLFKETQVWTKMIVRNRAEYKCCG